MAKTLSSRQWAHYVRTAKESSYASIFEAYEKPSHDKIKAWRELTDKCAYAKIVSKNTFNFTVFRRVFTTTGTMYIIDTKEHSYAVPRYELMRMLQKEHEKELILYIIDVEAICRPFDELILWG